MIIFHHNDLDGRCAAAIVGYWPQARRTTPTYIEMDYKHELPINKIEKDECVVIVDFSFKPEAMEQIIAKTTNIIWCDHHESCKSYKYSIDIPGIRDFSQKGMSGCECTWKHFFPDKPMPSCVETIGDYDSWRLLHGDYTLEFYEGMKVQGWLADSKNWGLIFAQNSISPEMQRIHKEGKAAIKYRSNYCNDMIKHHGYATEIAGHKAYALNVYGFGSLAFGEKFKEFPICIAYINDGEKYTVSLYSTSIDVSVIAKKYQGGGHKEASGFICSTLPFERRML